VPITPAPYRPPFVKQLDGSRFQSFNCNCASDAMLVRRVTRNAKKPSAATIRRLTGDIHGGTNLNQVHQVNKQDYHFESVLKQPIDWDELMDLAKAGRGFILQLRYARIAATKHDCFRRKFKDNHSIFVNGMAQDGHLVGGDPGADGRYSGCPKGWQHYSKRLLRLAAGELDLSGLGTAAYRPLGAGRAYALLVPKGK
jgi:hypothetical protein